MIPAGLISAALRGKVTHVTVGAILYRIEAVDAAKLAAVGVAYLEGLRAAVDPVSVETEGTIRAESQSEEEAEERIEDYRAREKARAMRMHRAALSTSEGAAAYMERVQAYVMAGVVGIGEAADVPESPEAGIPGVIHHGVDWRPVAPLSPVRVVNSPRDPAEDMEAALRRHGDAGEWPLWAMEPTDCAILATMIARLAGGRADIVAPFRVESDAGGVT